MNAPILFMLAAPTCPAGWHPVPGAQPSRAGDAVALVLPSLYPLESAEITGEQAAMLAACLPPEGYAPERTEATGGEVIERTLGRWGQRVLDAEHFRGFAFPAPALAFVRAAHPGVEWAPGGADGYHDIGEIDLLHGWVEGRCVAVVCRLAPTPESL